MSKISIFYINMNIVKLSESAITEQEILIVRHHPITGSEIILNPETKHYIILDESGKFYHIYTKTESWVNVDQYCIAKKIPNTHKSVRWRDKLTSEYSPETFYDNVYPGQYEQLVNL